MISEALEILKKQDFGKGVFSLPSQMPIFNKCFFRPANQPDPRLGIVPIVGNEVSVESGDSTSPNTFFVNAKGQGKGKHRSTWSKFVPFESRSNSSRRVQSCSGGQGPSSDTRYIRYLKSNIT